MKIAYLNYLYDLRESSSGAGIHVEELAQAFRDLGQKVTVHYLNRFTSVASSFKNPVRGFVKKKLGCYFRQINGLVANGRYFIKEWRLVRDVKPDILLVRYNLLNISVCLISRILHIPLILEINAPMVYESRKFAHDVVNLPWIPELLERLSIRFADHSIVVSQVLKDFYVEMGIPAQKIDVIPNGVDARKIHPAMNIYDDLPLNYHLKGKTVLGFVGSFHYWHGVEILTRFIRNTLDRFEQAVFLLVGHGPLKDELEGTLNKEVERKKVLFTGFVSHNEVSKYLAVMDIVLAPYPKLELFYYSPLKLFEYMAAGKAIITSSQGQICTVIQHGMNGILVKPDDFDDFQKEAFRLIEDKKSRKRLGENARKSVLDGYTWQHSAEKIIFRMNQIIKSKNGSIKVDS